MPISPVNWTSHPQNRLGKTKRFLSLLSVRVRSQQLKIFNELFNPSAQTSVVDVGVSPAELLPDTNYFEKHYPYPRRLTAVSVENCSGLRSFYPQIKFVQASPGTRLPFPDKKFDLAVSWATLEHVGGYAEQRFFLRELVRISRHIFVTTPDRDCLYEPHTGTFIIHWLPLPWFRQICRFTGKSFWARPENFNPLKIGDIRKLCPELSIRKFKSFAVIPSHLLIYS